MPDLLSQDEIDALLSAVEEVAEPTGVMSASTEEEAATAYDFSHPQRLSREQARTLRNIHEVMVRNMAASLGAYLRGAVECRLISVDQMTYNEFVTGLPNPTCFNTLKVTPPGAIAALEINPSIAFPMIDRLLGASKLAGPLDRPLTSIESRLLSKVVDIMRQQVELLWRRTGDIRIELEAQDTNPHLVALAPATEMVVSVVIEMHVSDHSGLVNICVPYRPFQGFLAKFFTIGSYSYGQERGDDARERLLKALRRVPVEITVELARTSESVQTVGRLAAGEVLVTDRHVKGDAAGYVNGSRKLAGQEGTHRGRKAFRVKGLYGEGEADA
ncbi:MAG: flagellar motor switch protein FliM [Planctomycetes bacterium]|nr:flagellar motor switch protein FliM [Planctomycetota bacterium]